MFKMPITTGVARLIFLPAQLRINGDEGCVKFKAYKEVYKLTK